MMVNKIKKRRIMSELKDNQVLIKEKKNEKILDPKIQIMMEEYQKKIEKYDKKKKRNEYIDIECGNRIKTLRQRLDLRLVDFARLCSLNKGKLIRLENGSTSLTQDDAIRICFIAAKHGFLITFQWLLCLSHETPAAFYNTVEAKKKLEEYSDNLTVGRGLLDVATIFLEIKQLERIHGEGVIFIMVSDNRVHKYTKGDYVGGFSVQPQFYHHIDGQECIVSIKKHPDLQYVRTVYFKYPNIENTNHIQELLILLCTDTREPEIFREQEIHSISVIFYHRKNSEKFSHILNAIGTATNQTPISDK
jgi:transcriptional regulator with XRE-family HTH domain